MYCVRVLKPEKRQFAKIKKFLFVQGGDTLNKLSKRYTIVVTNVLMALFMSIVLTAAMTVFVNHGLTPVFFEKYLLMLPVAIVVAIPTAFVSSAIVRSIIHRIVE